MGGRAEPPEGTPEGGPGGEDEFRSVVFDESFVRAARIQELSAQERTSSGTRPVRRRGLRGGGGLSRQALALMLLVSMAFAAAVYLGTKHPYTPVRGSAAELSISLLPLQAGPAGVPTLTPELPTASGSASAGASASASGSSSASSSASPTPSSNASPTASAPGSPSASQPVEMLPDAYPSGSNGLGLPNPRHTDNFSKTQVLQALQLVQHYLEVSSLSPNVLTGGDTDAVRNLLASGQYAQFDQSISKPTDDRRHAATGWMVRFDPRQVKLAPGQPILDQGTMNFAEVGANTLELTSDYTFVYALAQTPAAIASASAASAAATPLQPRTTALAAPHPVVLFTVRREITYRFTAADIDDGHLELSDSVTQIGATSCDVDQSRFLQPVFALPSSTSSAFAQPTVAPQTATAVPDGAASPNATPSRTRGVAGTDPFDQNRPAWSVCGYMTGPTP
ncbi:SCO2583 family membrane protein [Streptacidiphilus sp. PAMC 29251]